MRNGAHDCDHDERGGNGERTRTDSHRRDSATHRGRVVQPWEGVGWFRDIEELTQRSPALRHVEHEEPLRRDLGAHIPFVLLEHGNRMVAITGARKRVARAPHLRIVK